MAATELSRRSHHPMAFVILMEVFDESESLIPIGRDRAVARNDNPFISLQREVDRLFDDFTRGFPAFGNGKFDLQPTMDVTETDKEIEITAELPGLEEKDVEVNVADNLLTIRGEKKAEKEEKNKGYRRRTQLRLVCTYR